jgi:uncharacterized protein
LPLSPEAFSPPAKAHIAIQLLSVTTLWRSIDWHSLPAFLAGGVLGVPAGLYLLLHLPNAVYRDIIGVLLIAYAGYLLLRPPIRALQTGPLWDVCAGFLGGLTGGLVGFPGAFLLLNFGKPRLEIKRIVVTHEAAVS